MKFFTAFAALASFVSADYTHASNPVSSLPKCCNVCPAGTIKSYYIDHAVDACGVQCVTSDKFWLHQHWVSDLKKAQSNTATPCENAGYGDYWETIGSYDGILGDFVAGYNAFAADYYKKTTSALQNIILIQI